MLQILYCFARWIVSQRASLVKISDDPIRAPHFSKKLLGRAHDIIEKLLGLNSVFLIPPVDIVLNLLQPSQLVSITYIRHMVLCVQLWCCILHDVNVCLPHLRRSHFRRWQLLKLWVDVTTSVALLRGTAFRTFFGRINFCLAFILIVFKILFHLAQLGSNFLFVFNVLELFHSLFICFPLIYLVYLSLKITFVLVFFGFSRVKLKFSDVFKVIWRPHVFQFIARRTVMSGFLPLWVWRCGYVHLNPTILSHLCSESVVHSDDLALSVSNRCAASLLVAEPVVGVVLLHISKI